MIGEKAFHHTLSLMKSDKPISRQLMDDYQSAFINPALLISPLKQLTFPVLVMCSATGFGQGKIML
jgi:hypothetical protein